ncbi:CLUMA_CG009122, isoform A [Clunio marinus]|uniref:CLUMA_CG009122, isoform A n=1 Tax=Clunio marinus TaxID=568069 RepID=A0A1J1I5W6_9DIPT|nr:CLUMA_CG009122, isoform A [Clunio marinus]
MEMIAVVMNHLMVERPRKLLKTAAFEEPEDSSEYDVSTEGSQDINEPTSKTQWEELQEFYFKMGIKRALNASMESLMEDEDACKINLSNLYRESSSQLSVKSNEPAKSDDTVAVIEKLLKSFEQENNLTDSTTDLKTEETPNSLIEEKEINEKEMIEIACEENKINEDLSEENFEKIDIEIDNKIIEENLEKIDTEIESKINEFETEVINIDKETKLIENEENVNVDDQVVKDSINDDNFQNVLIPNRMKI